MAVDSIMKALRHQIKEIEVLVLESRRNDGRLDKFKDVLEDKSVEDDVIRSTIELVDIFASSGE